MKGRSFMFKIVNVSRDEYERFNEAENANHSDIFHMITAEDGEKYLITHGVGGYIIKGGIGRDINQVYESCLYNNYITDGEKVNICCCYGGEIDTSFSKYNTEIINDTETKLYIRRIKFGNVCRLVMYSGNSIINPIKARFQDLNVLFSSAFSKAVKEA